MSAIFDSNSPYASSSNSYHSHPQDAYSSSSSSNHQPSLQFYSSNNNNSNSNRAPTSPAYSDGYASGSAGRPSLEGNMNSSMNPTSGNMNMMNSQLGFWSAFGTGGFPDEPGLLEGMYRSRARNEGWHLPKKSRLGL